jgi:hypothetical protein
MQLEFESVNKSQLSDVYSRSLLGQNFTLDVFPEISQLKIDLSRCPGKKRRGGGKRGAVTGFSSDARRRMIYGLSKCENDLEYFVTLTYPCKFPVDMKTIKKNEKRIKEAFSKKFSDCVAFCKLEPQKRGAPHHHFLLEILEDFNIREAQTWLAHTWYNIVGSGDEKHLKAGTQFKKLKNKKMMKHYISKYCAKVDDVSGQLWGNRTGRIGKPTYSTAETYLLNASEFFLLRRIFKRWLKNKKRYFSDKLSFLKSFSLFAKKSFIESAIEYINKTVPASFVYPVPI